MPRFMIDNTEGYTQFELDELNRRFAVAVAAEGPIAEDAHKSREDRIAECVQAEFDTYR